MKRRHENMTNNLKTEWYCPVRKADGREYLSLTEIACHPDLVYRHIEDNGQKIPAWHGANPVQRIVSVKVTETREYCHA